MTLWTCVFQGNLRETTPNCLEIFRKIPGKFIWKYYESSRKVQEKYQKISRMYCKVLGEYWTILEKYLGIRPGIRYNLTTNGCEKKRCSGKMYAKFYAVFVEKCVSRGFCNFGKAIYAIFWNFEFCVCDFWHINQYFHVILR